MTSQQSQSKITSKNLSYSSDLPPFLARLRGQQQQQRDSDAPDPILAARRRAARPRSASEEAEDAPLVVDEAGNAVAFPNTDDHVPIEVKGDDTNGAKANNEKEGAKDKDKEKVAGIGAGKKRKVGRIVGGDEEGDEIGMNLNASGPLAKVVRSMTTKDKDATNANSKDSKPNTKEGKKKKAKKIKLSFGDDGD
ncbi:hypothetical protein F4677DRAFT_235518 [Hypoxylon crocopeplum]|nr:hypothetical protein F4677DRAFT_235518 [Hypoxylon crocopeplum]